mgnify:CR=1 FL=1
MPCCTLPVTLPGFVIFASLPLSEVVALSVPLLILVLFPPGVVVPLLSDGFGLMLSFAIVNSLTTSPSYNVLNVTTASYVPSSLISVTTVPVALFL